jgi:L-rhamnonate dehydratase
MFKGSMFYGRKGITLATISVVDLAIWDLLGKIRGEPVYKMIGGRTKKDIPLYLTGPLPVEAKRMGFWGGKVPLPHGPHEGPEGLRKNVAFLKGHREAVGPDFPIMVDCYMSLNVQYAIELAQVCTSSCAYMSFLLLTLCFCVLRLVSTKKSTSTGGRKYCTQMTLTDIDS